MAKIVLYKKHTPYSLNLPAPEFNVLTAQEIATLPDGRTVVVLEDAFDLPEVQQPEIKGSIEKLVPPLPSNLRDAIKAASPHVRMINAMVAEKIAQRYSTADEIKLLRTAPSAEMEAYNAYCEECRNWGRVEKAKLGL